MDEVEKFEGIRECEICGGDNSGKTMFIDHDHSSGRVRGALCHWCNLALGAVQDNPDTLAAMILYLKERS